MKRRWLPQVLRGYERSWLLADVLAGLTLAAVAVPSQMATAHLASVPVVLGLYAFVAAAVAYSFIGTNRHLVVGADSTIAPVLATGIAAVAVSTAGRTNAAAVTALLVGAILIVVGLLRLGWVSQLLSTPVVTGILAGIAVSIVVRELPVVLGLPNSGTSTIGRIQHLVEHLGQANLWTFAVSLGVLALIVTGQLVDRRVPGAFAALVLSVAASAALHLHNHGVAPVGHVHGGAPHFGWPFTSLSEAGSLAGTALTIAFLCVAQTAATIRASNTTADPTDDFNRDLIGVGAGSIVAGLSGTFPVNASPPNTALVISASGRSQMTNLIAAVLIVVVVAVGTLPLAQLPEATLGATLLFIATRLFKIGELKRVWRFDHLEFGVACVTLIVVALVGIEQGVAVAMVLSLADRTQKAARPKDAILGRADGTDHWIPVDIGHHTEQVSGVLTYLVYSPLWYGNADYFRLRLRHLIDCNPVPVKAVVLDANAMGDIDYTGIRALADVAAQLKAENITLGLARSSHWLHHGLKHGALLDEIGADHLFESVEDAVRALAPTP